MEQTLLNMASELTGLQSAQKVIQDRIDQIMDALDGQRRPMHARTLPPAPAKKAVPPSKAKLEALARARAALAARRKQEAAGGNGQAKRVRAKRGSKAGSKKGTGQKPGAAAA